MARSIIAVLFAVALVVHSAPVAAQDVLRDPYSPKKASPKKATPNKGANDPLQDPYGSKRKPPSKDSLQDPYGVAKKKKPATIISVPKASAVDNAVAAALLARGNILFARKDFANARQLYIESLVRSPKGTSGTQALDMLKQANAKLGKKDVYSGAPTVVRPAAPDRPLDPYDTGDKTNDKTTGPLDPYTDPNKTKQPEGSDPLDPYAPNKGTIAKPDSPRDGPGAARRGRSMLVGWSGLLGLTVGLALGGPEDDTGGASGGGVVVGLVGAGATAGLSYWLTKKRKLSAGQSAAILSAGTWGAYNIGLFADTLKTQGTSTNDVFAGLAIGGVLGAVAGTAYALKHKPTANDVALMNSFGAYGTMAGLMFGVAMDPPESEAYNVNAMLGSVGGIALGMLAAKKLDVSRSRMLRVDLGAGIGVAATWALFYPLISDSAKTGDEQAAGLISVAGMVGGAYAAWYLTRNMGNKRKRLVNEGVASPVPALLRRSSVGTWSTGMPIPRPIHNPALAPRSRTTPMGIDLAGGWF